MFLKRLRLKNFKCFSDLELSFEEGKSVRKWTILLGPNGLGKSSLLKAIALVTAGSEALTELLRDPSEWVRNGQKRAELEAELVTKGKETRTIKLIIRRSGTVSTFLKENNEGLDLLDRAIGHATRNYFVAGYGAARRLSSSDVSGLRGKTSTYTSTRAQNVATLFDSSATLNSLEQWAMNLDYLSKDGDAGLQVVRQVLDEFLPDVSFGKLDRRKGQLLFKTPEGLVPLNALSDGYQSVTAWVGDLLYRIIETFGDYKKPLEARGLLLIDELDLHLHPRWQRRLIDFLDKQLPNMQILTTTHSPLTAQQGREGFLHALTRKNGIITLEPFEGDPSTMLVNQLLMTDAFGVETDESIVVQGQKERYRTLKDKKRLSPREKQEFTGLKRDLTTLPEGGRTNQLLSQHQVDLLQKLDRELSSRR
jgi:predicted ATPase